MRDLTTNRTTREALPYYCLARILVPKASNDLQMEIEQIVHMADGTYHEAQRLLAEAKAEVKHLIEGK